MTELPGLVPHLEHRLIMLERHPKVSAHNGFFEGHFA